MNRPVWWRRAARQNWHKNQNQNIEDAVNFPRAISTVSILFASPWRSRRAESMALRKSPSLNEAVWRCRGTFWDRLESTGIYWHPRVYQCTVLVRQQWYHHVEDARAIWRVAKQGDGIPGGFLRGYPSHWGIRWVAVRLQRRLNSSIVVSFLKWKGSSMWLNSWNTGPLCLRLCCRVCRAGRFNWGWGNVNKSWWSCCRSHWTGGSLSCLIYSLTSLGKFFQVDLIIAAVLHFYKIAHLNCRINRPPWAEGRDESLRKVFHFFLNL